MSDPVTKKSLELVADNSEPAAADTVSKKTVAENTILENDKEAIDISSPEYYENRELSHFKFNQRVLSQARNKKHPLLDRLMFLLIFSSNLDEFFEIRVSGLK